MAAKLTPRKAPRQERAKATVEAIVAAAERLTRENGLEAWTTNHAAELAGASIGSLYQYFPSKESLVVALYLHRREAYSERLASRLATSARATPGDAALAVVDAWFPREPDAVIDWAFDLGLRVYLAASGAERKLVASDDQLAHLFGQLVARGGWAPAATAASRGRLALAAIERLLAPLCRDDPRWRTDPALRPCLVSVIAGALG